MISALALFQWILIFFAYSCIGWLCESLWCSVGSKKMINRGFLHGPWCPIYGFGGIFSVVLTQWFTAYPLLVFLIVMVACSLLEYFTGWLMETLFHTTWWDYSERKFNIKGRICLRNSLLFGLMGLAAVYFVHPKAAKILGLIPVDIQMLATGLLLALFMLDFLTSLAAVSKLQEKLAGIRLTLEEFSQNPEKYSWFDKKDILGSLTRFKSMHLTQSESNKITEGIKKFEEHFRGKNIASRLIKAYPAMKPKGFSIEFETFKKGLELSREKTERQVISVQNKIKSTAKRLFSEIKESYRGITLTKMIWVFIIPSIIGFIIETLWCLITLGVIQSRQGLLYGPFSQVYGMGAVLMVLLLSPFAAKGDGWLFFGGAIIGGIYEAICSFTQEGIFGSVSWEYEEIPFSLFGGRTHLLYMLFWGILTIVYMKHIYPRLIKLIDYIPKGLRTFLTWAMCILLVLDMGLSALAVNRWSQRINGAQANNSLEIWLDHIYSDKRMEKIYPNMVFR